MEVPEKQMEPKAIFRSVLAENLQNWLKAMNPQAAVEQYVLEEEEWPDQEGWGARRSGEQKERKNGQNSEET